MGYFELQTPQKRNSNVELKKKKKRLQSGTKNLLKTTAL